MLKQKTTGTFKPIEYCKRCGEPTLQEMEVLGLKSQIETPCKCKLAEIEKTEQTRRDREKEELKAERIKRWEERSGQGKEYSFHCDKYPQSNLSQLAHNFIDTVEDSRPKGYGLLLSGVKGCGKTFITACMGRVLSIKGYTVEMISAPRLVQMVQTNKFNNDCLWKYQVCDYLILDDLAAERSTEFGQEIIFQVVDGRYIKRKPIIASTNLSLNELKNTDNLLQGRVFDRLLERCMPYECEKRNHRAELSCYNEMKELLQL